MALPKAETKLINPLIIFTSKMVNPTKTESSVFNMVIILVQMTAGVARVRAWLPC